MSDIAIKMKADRLTKEQAQKVLNGETVNVRIGYFEYCWFMTSAQYIKRAIYEHGSYRTFDLFDRESGVEIPF